MFGALKNIANLKKLWTKKNLGYLDMTLSILTGKEFDPAYSAFWKQFSTKFPHPEAAKEAYASLVELHQFVRTELNRG